MANWIGGRISYSRECTVASQGVLNRENRSVPSIESTSRLRGFWDGWHRGICIQQRRCIYHVQKDVCLLQAGKLIAFDQGKER